MFRGSAFKGVGAWLVAAVALAALISAAGGNAQGQAEVASESEAPATVKFYPSRDVELFAPPPLRLFPEPGVTQTATSTFSTDR